MKTKIMTRVFDRWNDNEDVTDKVERQEVGYRFQQQRPDMPTPRFLEVPATEEEFGEGS